MGTLQQKAVKGITWSTAATIVNAVMQIGYTSIMARLLDPKAFGLVATSQLIIRFAVYFSEMGLGKALIQKEKLEDSDVRAAFTGTALLGVFFFVATLVAAPHIYRQFLDDEALVDVIKFMSLNFVVTGLVGTSLNLLRRRLEFQTLSIIEISTYIFSYAVVGVGLAMQGFGVYALLSATLTQSILTGIIAYALVRHSVAPIFKWTAYKGLLAYGSRMSLISFLEFISNNMDTFIIGRQLGARALGFYNRAWMLIFLPIINLSTSVSRVLFPTLSSIQSDIERLRRVYLDTIKFVAFGVVPICAGVAVASEEAVLTLLGPRWTASIPLLQLIALVAPVKILMTFGGIICDATDRLQTKMKLELVYIIFLATALLFVFRDYGVIGVAIMVLIAEIFKNIAYAFVLKRILGYSIYKDVVLGYVPAAAAGVLVGGSIYLVRLLMPATFIAEVPLAALGIDAVVGGAMLIVGLIIPTGAPIRHIVWQRFLGKSKLASKPILVRLFMPQ